MLPILTDLLSLSLSLSLSLFLSLSLSLQDRQLQVTAMSLPTPLKELGKHRVVDMSLGPTHSTVLTELGRVSLMLHTHTLTASLYIVFQKLLICIVCLVVTDFMSFRFLRLVVILRASCVLETLNLRILQYLSGTAIPLPP